MVRSGSECSSNKGDGKAHEVLCAQLARLVVVDEVVGEADAVPVLLTGEVVAEGGHGLECGVECHAGVL